MSFSHTSRPSYVKALTQNKYDLLVIGGGITGCGIALDATLRGLKVALVEQADFASGTSSRSTKLIHGGLRYLKQLELKLVHDVGRERAIVFQNARHIVIPEKMLLPIVQGGTLSARTTSIALWVYDLLAGVKKSEARKMLSLQNTLHEEPLLSHQKVIGGGLYYEYRTDDARLVIELAKSAVAHGAVCINYTQVTGLLYNEHKKVCGANVTDVLTNGAFEIKATKVVNAAGPFVDELRKTDHSLQGKRLLLTKGVHIVVPYDKLPLRHAVYFDVADGRMIFAIPRNGVTYIGTTDTIYKGDIDKPKANAADVVYLLDATNEMFPMAMLQISDVISSWAGLRPLIYEDGKSPSELSRRDEILVSPSGLISMVGGKLTGYRLMAKKIADLVAKELTMATRKFPKSSTHDYQLSGGAFDSDEALKVFAEHITNAHQYNFISTFVRRSWIYRYGSNVVQVLEIASTLRQQYANAEQLALAAEIQYCYENELCTTELDFVIRRSGMLYFDKVHLDKHIDFIHTYFSNLLRRTETQRTVSYTNFTSALHEVTEFSN